MPSLDRCARCVMPADGADITLCSSCSSEPRTRQAPQERLLESDFVRLLERNRGRGAYDCLVMCSGGKDSVAALWYMVNRFQARPLVFTFDQGFGNSGGVGNVRRAVARLGVDWVYFRSGYLREFFAEIVRSRAPVPMCPPCSLWYMQQTYQLAERHGIPLIITGWTRGQLDRPNAKQAVLREQEFPALAEATQSFIKRIRTTHPRYRDFPLTMAEVRRRHRRIMIVSPHWFLPHHESDYRSLVIRELGWEPVPDSWPAGSVNCRLNYLAAWLSMRDHGFTHHHIELSQLVRLGEITRMDALRLLRIDVQEEPARTMIPQVLEELGLGMEDLGGLEQPWLD